MSMLDRLVAPAHDVFITAEDFARRTQKLYDKAYPLPCGACGRRDEERRPHTLSDGRTVIIGLYCRCGAYKGPAIATPMEAYNANRRVVAAPRKPSSPEQIDDNPESIGDLVREAIVHPRPATPTHVAASSPERERPSSPLSPDRRFAFLAACAKLGADEHRIRCELAALGEELEDCTEEASRTVYLTIKASVAA